MVNQDNPNLTGSPTNQSWIGQEAHDGRRNLPERLGNAGCDALPDLAPSVAVGRAGGPGLAHALDSSRVDAVVPRPGGSGALVDSGKDGFLPPMRYSLHSSGTSERVGTVNPFPARL